MRRGTRVGQAYVAVTADGSGINEEIVNSVDDAGKDIDEKGDEHGRRYGDHFSEGFFSRMRSKFSKRFSSDMGDAGDEGGKHFTRRFEDHFDNDFLDRLGARVGGHFIDSLNFALSREGGDNPLADLFDRWMVDAVSGNGRGRRGRAEGIGALVGRMFGAGSRNNFLNVLGKSMGGIVTGFEKMFELSRGFAANMKNAGEGASMIQRLTAGFTGGAEAGGLSKMFSSLAASGPGAAVAVVAVTLALSIMASVVGALLALLTALVSTIVSGLVGALGVLGGALAAGVAGAGLLTAAFMSMTDAQQNLLKRAFLPLKAEMVGLGQIMLKDMVPAFSTWSSNLQRALLQALPVAQVMGKAFAEAGNILTRSFSGPGFQRFAQSLATFLPSITTRLASALGGFLNGLLGLFAALMPYVNQFAGYLAQVADRFSRWANSAQGQNSIVDWVGRALVSLKSLWGFVTQFSGFLARILFSPEAQKAGNTIFDGLARTFKRFTDRIAKAQADGSLQRWFNDAIKFGGQLWSVIQALGKMFIALYNSGVLTAVGKALGALANVINALNSLLGPFVNAMGGALPTALKIALTPLNTAANAVIAVGNAVKWVLDLLGQYKSVSGHIYGTPTGGIGGLLTAPLGSAASPAPSNANVAEANLNGLISSGNTALSNTSISSGGFKPPKKWHNPWRKWALSLIKEGPSVSAQIKNAILSVNKQAAAGILAASRASTSGDVQASLQSLSSSITTSASETVNTARSALNSAAQSLADASSKGAAKKALAQVKKAQKNLSAALKNQKRIQAAAKIINAQRVVTGANVTKLLQGLSVQNATLADYADARARVAVMLENANQKLTEAIALRDDYKKQVSDSIKEFGSLITTQARVIDGVEQAMTAGDITANLQARLDKIKAFQNDLRLLLAQGLSNDAYKQIVDAGVEQGSLLAEALLSGGNGAIQNVNSLVGQINGIADSLGTETSSRMYQAGVDAAQGLVDGLTSLSAQLDAAAVRLGNSIAAAVKRALGIASPSRVLRDMMDYVGDGAVVGLDNQHAKVGSAAGRLARRIAVSPVNTYATSASGEVSGNGKDPRFRDLIVSTPTEDPKAVALEVLNEVTGRL
jgi:hypothetical protein